MRERLATAANALPLLDGELLGPVEPRFVLHALLVVAEQSADHIPSIAAADWRRCSALSTITTQVAIDMPSSASAVPAVAAITP